MTSEQLQPRFKDLVEELHQINETIDFDDALEEQLQNLLNDAKKLNQQMQGEIAC